MIFYSANHNKYCLLCHLLKYFEGSLTVKTQIRLLIKEQSDLGPQCLPLYIHTLIMLVMLHGHFPIISL